MSQLSDITRSEFYFNLSYFWTDFDIPKVSWAVYHVRSGYPSHNGGAPCHLPSVSVTMSSEEDHRSRTSAPSTTHSTDQPSTSTPLPHPQRARRLPQCLTDSAIGRELEISVSALESDNDTAEETDWVAERLAYSTTEDEETVCSLQLLQLLQARLMLSGAAAGTPVDESGNYRE